MVKVPPNRPPVVDCWTTTAAKTTTKKKKKTTPSYCRSTSSEGCSTTCRHLHTNDYHCCRTVKVQRQTQALLQLHHAATCSFTEDECSVLRDCRTWQTWWNLLTKRDSSINTDTADLSLIQQSWRHLNTCSNEKCAICGPVVHEIGTDSPLLLVCYPKQKQEQDVQEEDDDLVCFCEQQEEEYEQYNVCYTTQQEQLEEEVQEEEDDDLVCFSEEEYEQDNDVLDTDSVPDTYFVPQQQQVGEPIQTKDDVRMSSNETRKRRGSVETMRQSRRYKVDSTVPRESSLKEGNQQQQLPTRRESPNATPPYTTTNMWESLSVDEIAHHLDSLQIEVRSPLPSAVKASCSEFLKRLEAHKLAWLFESPIDPTKLDMPDYFEIISKPMDLGTVRTKLETNRYACVEELQNDILQTFDNALQYESQGSVVYDVADELKKQALQEAPVYLGPHQEEASPQDKDDDDKDQRTCALCGGSQVYFKPPVYFCTDTQCRRKRIRRNQHFYVVGNEGNHLCCTPCYNKYDSIISVQSNGGWIQIPKKDMVKHKNDIVQEELWSQCSECDVWVHQVCGMVNVKQGNVAEKYRCPNCVLFEKEQESDEKEEKTNSRFRTAQDLPRTRVSDFIERHVKERIETAKRELLQETAEQENVSLEQATQMIDMGGSITIRQVTCSRKHLKVPESMQKRYASSNYPLEYPYTSKCFLVFQKLDGIDVALFALYVYEHGDDNPSPNKGRVHISLLDSVHYMRPRQLRTIIYHEVLIRYLDYARSHGFHTAHIWACPPMNGEDYIFNSKPEGQKRPGDARLRRWYVDMLKKCQERKIVGEVTNVYDLYFNESLDATALPFLEGDYISGEVDSIIHELAEGDQEWRPSSMQITASRAYKRDPVMVKLGKKIRPMKDDFIVADLQSVDDATRDELPAAVSDDLLEDTVEEVNYEIFNDRQKLVNLCLGNYYQFGELRRAKHSSMMLLWHMHSRNWS